MDIKIRIEGEICLAPILCGFGGEKGLVEEVLV